MDTDSKEIIDYCFKKNIKTIKRLDFLKENSANGNDLLNYHYSLFPNYDFYVQLFATAPLFSTKSINNCLLNLIENEQEYDSSFSAVKRFGFFWMESFNKDKKNIIYPVNYMPSILPRSQDSICLIEETTAMYVINNRSLKKYKQRIGEKPIPFFIPENESIDLNTENDFKNLDFLIKSKTN